MDFAPNMPLSLGSGDQHFLDEGALLSMRTSELENVAIEGENMDMSSVSYQKIFFASFAGFSALFAVYCYILGFSRLASRPKGFIMNLSELLVSETHAVLASAAGIRITLQTWSDVIFAQSTLTNIYAVIFCGYLVSDMVTMYLVESRLGKTFGEFIKSKLSIYFHHFAFVFMVPPVALYLRDGKGDHFIGCFLIMELPAIFLHFQHALSIFKMTGSKLYVVNGIVTMISYFFLRIAIFPYMFYRLAVRKGKPFWQIYKYIPKSCILGSGTCLALQLYWFGLMCRKVIRMSKQQLIVKEKEKEI